MLAALPVSGRGLARKQVFGAAKISSVGAREYRMLSPRWASCAMVAVGGTQINRMTAASVRSGARTGDANDLRA